jgi:hypothetical protein
MVPDSVLCLGWFDVAWDDGALTLLHVFHGLLPWFLIHQGREIIAIGALENGAFCTVFSENFHKF